LFGNRSTVAHEISEILTLLDYQIVRALLLPTFVYVTLLVFEKLNCPT